MLSLTYSAETANKATQLLLAFVLQEGAVAMEQRFSSAEDVRQDEVVQSVLVKIIERCDANTVTEVAVVVIESTD